ncbi:MAG TPA: PAS domain S-box protein [Byssovorax sp.]|jgi:PAS domain S-box-containing protein
MSGEEDAHVVLRLAAASRALVVAVALLGAAVLVGWACGVGAPRGAELGLALLACAGVACLAVTARLCTLILGRSGSARRDTEARETTFSELLEGAPDAIVVTDSAGRIVVVNGQAERLFGHAREELVGQLVDVLVPGEVRAAHAAHREAYVRAPRARQMGSGVELRGRRKDGSTFPVEVSLSPLASPGRLLVASAIRDVTERNKLVEGRLRLAALVDASDDAIIGKTLDGIVTSWNEGAQRLFGYTADEIVGEPIGRLIPARCEHEEADILAQLQRGERVRLESVRCRKDGEEVHVSITSSPVRDAHGNVVGAAKIARDITDRRRAEDALAAAKDAAEAANHELEAFSYSVAHDLRAPLRGMNGFARVLLDDYGATLDAEGKDALEEIVLNAKKMGELIDALLSLARVTRSELRREAFDLAAAARSIVGDLCAAEPSRAVELVAPASLVAHLDPPLGRALLDNLIRNAWKFTARLPRARIELGVADAGGQRAFFVRDDGAGFDMAYAAKLFAPFQRLHAASEFAGTGIGLATAQRIVRRHGGRIWAESAVELGATFFFTVSERARSS